jgi:hypothetical protein
MKLVLLADPAPATENTQLLNSFSRNTVRNGKEPFTLYANQIFARTPSVYMPDGQIFQSLISLRNVNPDF